MFFVLYEECICIFIGWFGLKVLFISIVCFFCKKWFLKVKILNFLYCVGRFVLVFFCIVGWFSRICFLILLIVVIGIENFFVKFFIYFLL